MDPNQLPSDDVTASVTSDTQPMDVDIDSTEEDHRSTKPSASLGAGVDDGRVDRSTQLTPPPQPAAAAKPPVPESMFSPKPVAPERRASLGASASGGSDGGPPFPMSSSLQPPPLPAAQMGMQDQPEIPDPPALPRQPTTSSFPGSQTAGEAAAAAAAAADKQLNTSAVAVSSAGMPANRPRPLPLMMSSSKPKDVPPVPEPKAPPVQPDVDMEVEAPAAPPQQPPPPMANDVNHPEGQPPMEPQFPPPSAELTASVMRGPDMVTAGGGSGGSFDGQPQPVDQPQNSSSSSAPSSLPPPAPNSQPLPAGQQFENAPNDPGLGNNGTMMMPQQSQQLSPPQQAPPQGFPLPQQQQQSLSPAQPQMQQNVSMQPQQPRNDFPLQQQYLKSPPPPQQQQYPAQQMQQQPQPQLHMQHQPQAQHQGPPPLGFQQHHPQQHQQQLFNAGMPLPNTPQQGAGALGGMRELRVEDALLYLDDVKREFKDRPAIYNEFLAIMKNFKTQEVDTPGVIARVSKLFRGYNNLILGFNTFLPDGFKISLADLERAEALRLAEEAAAAKAKKPKGPGAKRGPKPKQSPKQPPGAAGQSGYMQARQMNKASPPTGSPMQQQQWSPQGLSPHGMPPPGHSPPKPPGQPPRGPFQQQQAMPQQAPHQAVEFDHAISYVTTIKKRFASDPNTYHSFLEILHTYQKEQRGIKEVLEQVAHLFQDHPDLLKEFTFFLPDAVQEQAKERLHRAAAESESRIAAQRQQQMEYHQRMGGDAQQHFIDMTRSQLGLAAAQKRGADGQPMPMMHQPPESYVYNSAVERQFFDSAREALSSYSRDGGQAWAEFLKCLDMYAQEILSRSEMLNFVQPLLGKRNNQLFEEFKRILNAAGSPNSSLQMIEDSWYSVPLAEIDFSRCRRCSPSYRALPRDYPAHPCSGRSEEEARALNDIWVSLPVGSEESYTFRHMRRNTYEETLFRVEDERFEIDMVIDSNAATLQRLEPVAEEIALLSQGEAIPVDLGIKPPIEGAGLGGKRFQYTFDKKILGAIHCNAITRIYGESGQEMLDLLVKNPSVAVPLVVSRLRQKDSEWRIVRERLNKHWKELAEHNYYKSLDHRSLTWRTVDKRAISTRTLIAEIKDRAANQGREGREAMRQKLEKAKEEHGTFYEVTVGNKLSTAIDLTFLPKPDRRLFTPHLSLEYKNVSWAQRDAYRILAFALERGPISPADKERCHRLWVEFLGPWFDLSLGWMQKPAVTYQESSTGAMRTGRAAPATIVSEDDEESLDEEPELVSHMVTEVLQADARDKEFTDHHPLPAGAHVSTLYGEGKVIEFRRTDHIYAVQLKFGTIGYLRPATVLCSMLPVEKSAYTRQLRADDRSKLARPNDQLAFGTQSLYLFFRLHQILVNRLNTAKRLAFSVGDDQSLQSMVEQMPSVNPKAVGRRRYEAYLSLVYALLDGGVGGAAEGGKYEDRVRSLLGHGGYELATMDKLISHIWKDIQLMANDETMWNLVQLYRRHSLAGGFQPEAFRQEAAYLSDGEPMYAFQHCPISNRDASVLHIEYVGVMDDVEEDDMEEEIEPVVEQQNKRQKR